MTETHKKKGAGSHPAPSNKSTHGMKHSTPSKRGSRPTEIDLAKVHQQSSALHGRVLDDLYRAEVRRFKPVSAFRKAGAKLLPLQVVEADAQDFGKHYFIRTVNGVQLFESQEEFPATLVRDVLTRVIEGCAR